MTVHVPIGTKALDEPTAIRWAKLRPKRGCARAQCVDHALPAQSTGFRRGDGAPHRTQRATHVAARDAVLERVVQITRQQLGDRRVRPRQQTPPRQRVDAPAITARREGQCGIHHREAGAE